MNSTQNPPQSPIEQIKHWLEEAEKQESSYANAMTLSTLDKDGYPQARIVLLKGFDGDGLQFFTNYESSKAIELAHHKKACLNFYWKSLCKQIRILGDVEKVSDEASDAYFATRPRDSQLGAWASMQSQPMEESDGLEKRMAFFREKYDGSPVPRPPHWGGYCLTPQKIEFWQEKDFRLHNRTIFERSGDGWTVKRLYP